MGRQGSTWGLEERVPWPDRFGKQHTTSFTWKFVMYIRALESEQPCKQIRRTLIFENVPGHKTFAYVMSMHLGRCHGDTGAEEGTASLDRGIGWVEACLDGM